MKLVGYARISSVGQKLQAQLEQLDAAGCNPVMQETMSGARAARPQLRRAIDALSAGDVLVVTRLDRLARSTRDLLDLVEEITGKGAALRSLAETWADTSTPAGRMILTVFAGLAEFERHLINERTSAGRASAQARGVKMGPKHKLTAHQRNEVRARLASGEPQRDIAASYNVSQSSISRVRP